MTTTDTPSRPKGVDEYYAHVSFFLSMAAAVSDLSYVDLLGRAARLARIENPANMDLGDWRRLAAAGEAYASAYFEDVPPMGDDVE